MSFLTTLISSFPILSYSLHHITLSSSHFHSHRISSWSPFTSLFSLSSLSSYSSIHSNHIYVFSHHLICITLITSHIHLSFITHHPHYILLPFHHSRIFHFSTHPFHHGALRDFLKTHFQPFHLSYLAIHYFILLSFLFHLHHPHHHTSLLFILIRIYDLYSFISIHSHTILPLTHFHHTHSLYPFPFQSSHSIPFHHSHSFTIPRLTPHSLTFSVIITLHYLPFSFISSIPILNPLFPMNLYPIHVIFTSHLRLSTMRSMPCLFGYLLSHCHLLCWKETLSVN